MGLDLWFPDDMTRILTALASAGKHYGPEYARALRHVGLALGLDLSQQIAGVAAPRPLNYQVIECEDGSEIVVDSW